MKSLEEAITQVVSIIKQSMTEDARWAFLASHIGDLVEDAKIITSFSIDLFVVDRRVMLTEGVDLAGADLRVALCDVLEVTDRPQMGPLAWLAIARLIMQLLEQINSRTN